MTREPTEMEKRVALALYGTGMTGATFEQISPQFLVFSRIAIRAMREPTLDMTPGLASLPSAHTSGESARYSISIPNSVVAWRHMIDVASPPESQS